MAKYYAVSYDTRRFEVTFCMKRPKSGIVEEIVEDVFRLPDLKTLGWQGYKIDSDEQRLVNAADFCRGKLKEYRNCAKNKCFITFGFSDEVTYKMFLSGTGWRIIM